MRHVVCAVLLSLTLGLSGCGAWIGGGLVIASATDSGGGGGGGTTVVSADDVPQVVELNLAAGSPPATRPDDLSRVSISFRLIERSSEQANVSVEFSQDGFATVRSATITSPSLVGRPTSPDGTAATLVWNASADGLSGEALVDVRVRAADATGAGAPATVRGLIGNLPPVVSNLQIASASRTGTIPFTYQLSDSAGDPLRVSIEFKLSGDPDSAFRALQPVVGAVDSLASGLASFAWDSLAAEPAGVGARVADVELRMTPRDDLNGGVGASVRLGPIRIENNQRPTAAIVGFDSGVDEVGPVAVPFLVSDLESDPIDVLVQWRTLDQPGFPDLDDPSLNLLVDPADPRFVGASVESAAVRAALMSPVNADIRAALQLVTEVETRRSIRAGFGSTTDTIVVPGLESLAPAIARGGVTLESAATTAPVTSYSMGRLLLDGAGLPSAPTPGDGLILKIDALQGLPLPSLPTGEPYRLIWNTPADVRHSLGLPVQIRISPFDGREGAATTSVTVTREIQGDLQFRADTGVGLPFNFTASGLESADINGDGAADLVLAGQSEVIHVYFADSRTGAFSETPSRVIPMASGDIPRDVAVGDFNNDGRPDIAVALSELPVSQGSLAVYLQTSTGQFPSTPDLRLARAGRVRSVAVGRLNGDDRDDLVYGLVPPPGSSGEVGVLLQGTGGLPSSPSQILTVGSKLTDIAIGDLNQDQRLDLAISQKDDTTSAIGRVEVVFQSAGSTFSATPDLTLVSGGNSSESIALGDFDDDGDLDITVANLNGLDAMASLSIFRQGPAGTFSAARNVPGLFNPQQFTTVDVNNDGVEDLVVGAELEGTLATFELIVLLGGPSFGDLVGRRITLGGDVSALTSHIDPTGAFVIVAALFSDRLELIQPSDRRRLEDTRDLKLETPELPRFIASGDLNFDGRTDLAVLTDNPFQVQIFQQNLAGNFARSPVTTRSIGFQGVAAVVADLNGDLREDLAVTGRFSQATSNIVVFLQGDDGQLEASPSITLTADTSVSSLVAGDFDNDGRLDLAAGDSIDSTVVLMTQATGVLAVTARLTLAAGVGDLAVGDLNSDGRDDLAVSLSTFQDQLVVFRQQPSGLFAASPDQIIDLGNSRFNSKIAVGDISGDGRDDLVLADADSTNGLQCYVQSGGALSTMPVALTPPAGTGNGALRVVIADINADGRDDAVVLSGSDDVTFYRQSAAGRLETNPFFLRLFIDTSNFGVGALVVADLNGDGRNDVAVGNQSSNNVDLQHSVTITHQK